MGKREIRNSEWKRLYPLKKAILIFIWIFLVFVIIAGIKYCFCNVIEPGAIWTLILVINLTFLTFKPIWKYVYTAIHSIPFFNKIFTKEELEDLLEQEVFSDIIFLKEHGMNDIDVAESEHWLRLNRNYVSKEMAVLCWTEMQYGASSSRGSTLVYVLYLTGDIVKINLGLRFPVEVEVRFGEYMWCNLDIFDEEIYGKEKDRLINNCKEVYRAYVKEQAGVPEKEVIKNLIQNAEILRSICVDKMPHFLHKHMEEYSYAPYRSYNNW